MDTNSVHSSCSQLNDGTEQVNPDFWNKAAFVEDAIATAVQAVTTNMADETATPEGETAAGETAAGETAAGETAAGETAGAASETAGEAGETAAGETAAGETAGEAGETAAGEASETAGEAGEAGETGEASEASEASETAAGETAAGETAAGETAAGETAAGETAAGEAAEAGKAGETGEAGEAAEAEGEAGEASEAGEKESYSQLSNITTLTERFEVRLQEETDALHGVDWNRLCWYHYHWYTVMQQYESDLLCAYKKSYSWWCELREKQNDLPRLERVAAEASTTPVEVDDGDAFAFLRLQSDRQVYTKQCRIVQARVATLKRGLEHYRVDDHEKDITKRVHSAWRALLIKHPLPHGRLYPGGETIETLRWLRGHRLIDDASVFLQGTQLSVLLYPVSVLQFVASNIIFARLNVARSSLLFGANWLLCLAFAVYCMVSGQCAQLCGDRESERRRDYRRFCEGWTDHRCWLLVGVSMVMYSGIGAGEILGWVLCHFAMRHPMVSQRIHQVYRAVLPKEKEW